MLADQQRPMYESDDGPGSFISKVRTRNTLLPPYPGITHTVEKKGQVTNSGQITEHCTDLWRPAEQTAESNRVRCLSEAAAEREIATTR